MTRRVSDAQRQKAHRPSVSRVIPAIPHALGPKPRRPQEPARSANPSAKQLDRVATPPRSQENDQNDTTSAERADAPASAPTVSANGALTPPVETAGAISPDPRIAPIETPKASSSSGPVLDGMSDQATVAPARTNVQVQASDGSVAATTQQRELDEDKASAVNDQSQISQIGRMGTNGSLAHSIAHSNSTKAGSSHPAPLNLVAMPSATTSGGQDFMFSPTAGGPHPGAPPFVPGGHGFHTSDPSASPSFPPSFGQNGPYSTPREFYSHAGHGRGNFNPRRSNEHNLHPRFTHQHHGPLQLQSPGTPTSPDAAGRGFMAQAPPPGIGQVLEGPWAHGQYSPVPPHRQSISMASFPRGPYSKADPRAGSVLASYVHSQFGVGDYADHDIRVFHTLSAFAPFSLPGHAVILAQSPKLRSLMAMQPNVLAGPGMPLRVLPISVTDRFLDLDLAISKALMRLYGEELPTPTFVVQSFGLPGKPGATQDHMRFALAYAAAGHFLQNDEIVTCGLDLAEGFFTMDNIERALAFGLDGGLGASWTQREGVISEDRDSTSSLDGSQTKTDSPTASAPTYGYYSDRVLHRAVDFLSAKCTSAFTFSSSAPQLRETPRLPFVADTTRSRSKSSLAQIRFGEMASPQDDAGNLAANALSSVLVSLPFPVLKHLLEHPILVQSLGATGTGELMRDVISEREQRRQRAVLHRNGNVESTDERLWQAVRWVEKVESGSQHPSGLRVARSRLGTDTPTSAEFTGKT